MGEPDLFDYKLAKLEKNHWNKCREKIYRTEESNKTYIPKMLCESPSAVLSHVFSVFDQDLNRKISLE